MHEVRSTSKLPTQTFVVTHFVSNFLLPKTINSVLSSFILSLFLTIQSLILSSEDDISDKFFCTESEYLNLSLFVGVNLC